MAATDALLGEAAPNDVYLGIWQRPDPPVPELRSLCILADAKDASCVFRLPAAVDGTLPGFRVRRGGFGQEESLRARGPPSGSAR